MITRAFLLLVITSVMAAPATASTCVVAAPGSPLTITLNFVPPTLNTDGTPITLPLTYDVYMGTSSGGESQLATGITASPYSISAGLAAGNTYYVQMAAQDANGVGPKTNEACKTFSAAVLVITTTALPNATKGVAYSFTAASTGGTATWSASGLPAGLLINSITGNISGTPTTAGTSSVILKVANTAGASATATLSLVVLPSPTPGSFTITLT
jgi:hypothetical protein